ncbi:MAG TPA: hypothetical protein VNI02_00300 [Blastocatellia bacterium]|jgi:hypothetical protein|nr:hypothetical protein [Blastocatellia bacterium]
MRVKIVSLVLMLAGLSSAGIASQGGPSQASGQPPVDEIIRRFAAAESENKVARNNYTFTQDIDLVTLGEAGSITGRFHRISDIVFDDRGNRVEKITFYPPSTAAVTITKEDLQDIAGVQPFALTAEDIPNYQLTFLGKEKIDELNTYMFDVKPKQIRKGERYLQGRIWVDDQDLQVVKVAGQAVPEVGDQKFPHFESYRENIDGRYWFPTYIYVDDVLEFKKGPSVHLRMTVRFTKYKKFGGRIRLADEGEAATEEEVKAAEKNKPAAQPTVKPPEQSKPELKKKPPVE